jgi:hypothetical protein
MSPSGTPYSWCNVDLRTRALVTPPVEFGIEPTADYPRVYGILMDWPIGDRTVTVVSLCDGNASIYATSGLNVIGGFAHETVRNAACAFVRAAAEHHDDSYPTSEFSYPGPNRVRFYLLTFSGVRVINADLEAIKGGAPTRAADLFTRGQAVVTEYRLLAEKRLAEKLSAGDTTSGRHWKEWSDEPGYLNCLMTSMSRGVGRSIEISASAPVPNLLELAAGNDDLRAWIEAQEFLYASLKPEGIIQTLIESAKITGPLPSPRHGELLAMHALEDSGAIPRVFDITIAPFNRSARIELASDDDPRVRSLQVATNEGFLRARWG